MAREGPAADSIEVYTECELGAIHALWNLAGLRGRSGWRVRCLAAAAWVIEHLQPDNATGHPWAAHVFAIGAGEGLGPEGDLLAQTLLHNAMVNRGRPDRFAACVLRDCARACSAEAER